MIPPPLQRKEGEAFFGTKLGHLIKEIFVVTIPSIYIVVIMYISVFLFTYFISSKFFYASGSYFLCDIGQISLWVSLPSSVKLEGWHDDL